MWKRVSESPFWWDQEWVQTGAATHFAKTLIELLRKAKPNKRRGVGIQEGVACYQIEGLNGRGRAIYHVITRQREMYLGEGKVCDWNWRFHQRITLFAKASINPCFSVSRDPFDTMCIRKSQLWSWAWFLARDFLRHPVDRTRLKRGLRARDTEDGGCGCGVANCFLTRTCETK